MEMEDLSVIYMSILLIVLFLILIFMIIRTYRAEKLEFIMKKISPQLEQGKKSWFRWNVRDPSVRIYVWVLVGGLFGGAISLFNGGNFLLLASIGAIIPWIAVKQKRYAWEKAYRDDGKVAVQFLQGVISANGSMEDWIEEVIPRLRGPLKMEFQAGFDNLRRGVPITKFLETTYKNCPDSSLSLIFSGLIREQRQAGNLSEFLDGALLDLQNQDRYIRTMANIRKSSGTMLIWIYCFPGFFYLMFQKTVNEILKAHWIANIGLIVGILGYVLLAFWGIHMTKPMINSKPSRSG